MDHERERAVGRSAHPGQAGIQAPFTGRRLRELWDTEWDSERMGPVRDMLRNTDCDEDSQPTDAGLQRVADALNLLFAAATADLPGLVTRPTA